MLLFFFSVMQAVTVKTEYFNYNIEIYMEPFKIIIKIQQLLCLRLQLITIPNNSSGYCK